MFFNLSSKTKMVDPENALPGRASEMEIGVFHHVFAAPLQADFSAFQTIVFGMGCFWGAERIFWKLPGVVSTSAGYSGGTTPNPTYEEVCSGRTGHTEVVRVVFDPEKISLHALLTVFFENHDPTQGMRQGNDVGTQYRSAIYGTSDAQLETIVAARDLYQAELTKRGFGEITTEVDALGKYFFAEPYHQQYLSKNPNGYCGIGGTGVSCPVNWAVK